MKQTLSVAVIMGSSSDAPIMEEAVKVLRNYEVPYVFSVVSAHRSPHLMYEFAASLEERGIAVVIAGAGGAAHLPGMMAALTTVPVIGVPIKSSNSIDGWDSLLSIVQMPKDVPVATVAVNGAHNAGLLAVEMLSISNPELKKKLLALKEQNNKKVSEMNETLREMQVK
jgi:5-(carboxyamino)imidazole ribonucleotide mutase